MGVKSRSGRSSESKNKNERTVTVNTRKIANKPSYYKIFGFIAFVFILVCFQIYYLLPEDEEPELDTEYEETADYPGEHDVILVWWTPFTGEKGASRQCPKYKCFITENRTYQLHPNTRGFLFYGSNFEISDVPVPRQSQQEWALLHEESPKNMPVLGHQQVLFFFNYTSTFSRESHFPLTLQYLESVESLKGLRYFEDTRTRNGMRHIYAPVVYVQSTCDTSTQRDEYVSELMKHLPIDSYGACLKNRKLEQRLSDPVEGMNDEEFLSLLGKYKFHLSVENSACNDYITEKLWRPLIVGSVPIYFGSPSVKDWLPNPNSAILISDYNTTAELAAHILSLDEDDTAYEAHLTHKLYSNGIANYRLIEAMKQRPWGINNDDEQINFIEHFECSVCDEVSYNMEKLSKGEMIRKSEGNGSHYGCSAPITAMNRKPDAGSWWLELYQMGWVQAQVLQRFLSQNKNYTMTMFNDAVMEYIHENPDWKLKGIENLNS